MNLHNYQKTDYSALFSSLNSGANGMGSFSWLTDYSNIKKGSYSKLMRAYYSQDAADTTKAQGEKKTTHSSVLEELTAVSKDKVVAKETTAYDKLAVAAKELQDSVTKLGKLSEKESAQEQEKTVAAFVDSYNSMLKASGSADVSDGSIDNRVKTIRMQTTANLKKLQAIGIDTKTDGSLTLDKDVFAAADKSKVTEIFGGKASYGYAVGVSAAMVESNANYDARRESTYTGMGTYQIPTGTMWDSFT